MQKEQLHEQIMAIQILNAQRLVKLQRADPNEYLRMKFAQAFEPTLFKSDEDREEINAIIQKFEGTKTKEIKQAEAKMFGNKSLEVDDCESTCSSTSDDETHPLEI